MPIFFSQNWWFFKVPQWHLRCAPLWKTIKYGKKNFLAKIEEMFFFQSDVSMYCRSNRNHRNIYSNLYIEFTHNGTETNFFYTSTYTTLLFCNVNQKGTSNVNACTPSARQNSQVAPHWLRKPEPLIWLDKTFVFPPIWEEPEFLVVV